MATIALTKGERYSFARQGLTTVLTDSTDSAEATKLFNNNLTISGSTTRTLRIDTSTTANDAYMHFKSSTVNFSAGVDGTANTFTVSRAGSLTGAGSNNTALRIPDVSSPKVHFEHGIVVSGSVSGDLRFNQDTTTTPGYSNTTTGVAIEGHTSAIFVSRAGGLVANFNRNTDDGVIISLRRDGTEEGTITVSSGTVSLIGAHLSRWSQLPGGAERTEILRGTVLSNLDEMCEWIDEYNEQLNRMKVSDVEGDTNVSGVFQSWDDDDATYTNDFYCAMTGDFIIRIRSGVVVQKGDLLMSAGDGTAISQSDDIVRSKTIAKVTSTYVTCVYNDGSYCVPCVLMAC